MNQLPTNNSIGVAMDLRDFYISTEWDVMEVPAQRNEKYYPCCEVGELSIITLLFIVSPRSRILTSSSRSSSAGRLCSTQST